MLNFFMIMGSGSLSLTPTFIIEPLFIHMLSAPAFASLTREEETSILPAKEYI